MIVAAGLVVALAACSTDADTAGRSGSSADSRGAGDVHTTGQTTPTNDPDTPTYSMPTQDRTLPTFTDGVGMSEWLPYGGLEVRAIAYHKAAANGGTRTRIDVVTVEECADSRSVQVRHTTWHLVDASGRTLGSAGGKIVDGLPTEDIPPTLAPGECVQTDLAIAVPPNSTPVAAKDGAGDAWVLSD